MPDTVAKVPSGLHAAAKGPLKLAGGDAFLAGGAKQVDRLKPELKGKWLSSKIVPIRTVKVFRQA